MIIDNDLKNIILSNSFRGTSKVDTKQSFGSASYVTFKIREDNIGVNNIEYFHYTFDEFLRVINYTYSLSNFLLLMNIRVNAGTYIWTSAKMEFYYMGEVLSKYYIDKKDYNNFTKLNKNYRKIDSYFNHLINYNEVLEREYKIVIEATVRCRKKEMLNAVPKTIINKEKVAEEVLRKNHFTSFFRGFNPVVEESLSSEEKFYLYTLKYTVFSKTLTPAKLEKVINIFKGQGYKNVVIKATSFGEQFSDISI